MRKQYKHYDLDKIKEIPITEILNDLYGIETQKKGTHRAFCDIRGEKTPSCCLYLDTNTYCDFGDGNRGGNVINLVEQLSNCDFNTAIEMLAEHYGIVPEQAQNNLLPTNSQYAQIGIQADMATKNFQFDIEKYGIEHTKKFAEKYRMSVQELSKKEPRIYHNMLKNVAIPFINTGRQNYYSNLYTSYLLCSDLGGELTGAIVEELQNDINDLNKMESIMQRAITDNTMLKYTAHEYDIEKDLNDIMNGNLEFEIGNTSYMELKANSVKVQENLIYKKIPYNKFVNLRANLDFPVAAYVNGAKQEVNVITASSNRLRLEQLINPKSSSFQIETAQTQDEQIKKTPAEKPQPAQQKFNTVVVNMFAGPGAGKTTCAWEVASALKKKGLVVEYVSEVAKEYVWDNNTEILDGSVKNQRRLLEEQDKRVQRLLGKVEVIVTDSPILLNSIYVKEPDEIFNKEVIGRFKKQNNFNVFVERGKKFETEGRIHNYDESLKIDTQIQNLLSNNNLYYKKYTYPQIKQCIENINRYVQKCNGKPIRTDFQKDSISAYCKKFYMQEHNLNRIQEVVR